MLGLDQRGADGLGHQDHLQGVRLFDQRHADGVGSFQQSRGDCLDVSRPGQDHQASDLPRAGFVEQAQKVGLVTGMVDAGDEHQFAAQHPLGNTAVLGYIRPAHAIIQACATRPQAHALQPRQGQYIRHRQAHAWASADGTRTRRTAVSAM